MTEDLQNRIYELAAARIEGKLTPEERKELRELIDASQENKKFYQDCREVLLALSSDKASEKYNADEAFRRFRSTHPVRPHRTSAGNLAWKFALAAAAVVALCTISFKMGNEKVLDSFAEIVIEAPMGSRSRVVLPDSTEVWLNAGSRISYSQGFGFSDRTVRLSGEGHFKVTHNDEQPFIVETAELSVKDLGTIFNFRNYEDDMEAIVSLEEGKVALKNLLTQGEESVLSPNQKCVLDKASGKMTIDVSKAQSTTSWVDGSLFFDEELLPDIAKELERSYNVKISLADEKLKQFRFYGDFTREDLTIDDVLEALCATGRIHSRKDGNEITLY